jgi:hypothetical protein
MARQGVDGALAAGREPVVDGSPLHVRILIFLLLIVRTSLQCRMLNIVISLLLLVRN